MVNIWSRLFQFFTETRRHLRTALRQLVNSSIAQTSLIILAANSCCCRQQSSSCSLYPSRPASGYWSLVVTVIYSGPLSGHKTSPADDNSPDRLTAAIVLCSIVGTFAPFAVISLFMCPAGRSRVDRVFSLFLPLNTRRFIFFSPIVLYLLGWNFCGQAPGKKETRDVVLFYTLSMESWFFLQSIRSLSESSQINEISAKYNFKYLRNN